MLSTYAILVSLGDEEAFLGLKTSQIILDPFPATKTYCVAET